MKIQHKEDYRKLRQAEYPKIGEQLDAVFKLAISLRSQGLALPVETEKWVDKCLSIKTKYPKSI